MLKKTIIAIAMTALMQNVVASPSSTTAPEIPTQPVFGVQSVNKKTLDELSAEHKKRMEALNKDVSSRKKESSPSEWSDTYASYGTFDEEDLTDESIFKMLGIVEEKEVDEMPPDLEKLLKIDPIDDLKSSISEMRYKMIHESAYSYGMQGGLAYQTRLISDRLDAIGASLDNTYNFQRWIMQGNILPPVISEVKDAFEQESEDVIHIGLHNYEMISDPRLVTSAPSWRAYLKRAYSSSSKPRIALDPENSYEKKLWAKSVAQGYNKGVQQANRILVESWRTLFRDYAGIVKYHELLNKGVVSAPYVTATTRDVVGDGKRMTVGDVTLSIAVKPEFVLDRNKWGKNTKSGQKGYLGGKGRGAEVAPYVELKRSKNTRTK